MGVKLLWKEGIRGTDKTTIRCLDVFYWSLLDTVPNLRSLFWKSACEIKDYKHWGHLIMVKLDTPVLQGHGNT